MSEFFSFAGYSTPPVESLVIHKKSHKISSMVLNTLDLAFLLIKASIPRSLVSSFLVMVTFGLVSSFIKDS